MFSGCSSLSVIGRRKSVVNSTCTVDKHEQLTTRSSLDETYGFIAVCAALDAVAAVAAALQLLPLESENARKMF